MEVKAKLKGIWIGARKGRLVADFLQSLIGRGSNRLPLLHELSGTFLQAPEGPVASPPGRPP